MLLGIDVETKDVQRLIVRLARLKSTNTVCEGGMYHEDRSISQVHVDTKMDQDELANWLYKTSEIGYFGTFIIEEKTAQ